MLTQSNTDTECNANSHPYCYSVANSQSHSYVDADSYAEVYSVAEAAPHAASAPKPMMGQ